MKIIHQIRTGGRLLDPHCQISTNHDHVPVIKGNDRELKFEDTEKANALNQYFASISSVNDNDIMLPVLPNLETGEDMLTTLEINDEDVLFFLKKLDPNKAYGPDEISPLFVIKAAENLAPIFANIFRMCLRHQIFPKIWKRANVIPI
jgi:hypothetical protein